MFYFINKYITMVNLNRRKIEEIIKIILNSIKDATDINSLSVAFEEKKDLSNGYMYTISLYNKSKVFHCVYDSRFSVLTIEKGQFYPDRNRSLIFKYKPYKTITIY